MAKAKKVPRPNIFVGGEGNEVGHNYPLPFLMYIYIYIERERERESKYIAYMYNEGETKEGPNNPLQVRKLSITTTSTHFVLFLKNSKS